jgi:hypothetical protein
MTLFTKQIWIVSSRPRQEVTVDKSGGNGELHMLERATSIQTICYITPSNQQKSQRR